MNSEAICFEAKHDALADKDSELRVLHDLTTRLLDRLCEVGHLADR